MNRWSQQCNSQDPGCIRQLSQCCPHSQKPTLQLIATLYSRTQCIKVGLALVKIDEQKFFQVAVINTAPFYIHMERSDFLGAVEILEPETTQVHPFDSIP